MTKKHRDARPQDPTVKDLLALHRYARSRPHDASASASKFAKRDPGMTTDRFASLIQRLEKAFDCYVLKKRATAGREISEDIDWPEFASFHLDGRIDHEGISLVNKDRMTLAGEVLGEAASLAAGYLAIARMALDRDKKNGERRVEQDITAVRAWLTAERRRLDKVVMATCNKTLLIEQLGELAGDAAFEPDSSDCRDMTMAKETSPMHLDDPGTESAEVRPPQVKHERGPVPVFDAFASMRKAT